MFLFFLLKKNYILSIWMTIKVVLCVCLWPSFHIHLLECLYTYFLCDDITCYNNIKVDWFPHLNIKNKCINNWKTIIYNLIKMYEGSIINILYIVLDYFSNLLWTSKLRLRYSRISFSTLFMFSHYKLQNHCHGKEYS